MSDIAGWIDRNEDLTPQGATIAHMAEKLHIEGQMNMANGFLHTLL